MAAARPPQAPVIRLQKISASSYSFCFSRILVPHPYATPATPTSSDLLQFLAGNFFTSSAIIVYSVFGNSLRANTIGRALALSSNTVVIPESEEWLRNGSGSFDVKHDVLILTSYVVPNVRLTPGANDGSRTHDLPITKRMVHFRSGNQSICELYAPASQ